MNRDGSTLIIGAVRSDYLFWKLHHYSLTPVYTGVDRIRQKPETYSIVKLEKVTPKQISNRACFSPEIRMLTRNAPRHTRAHKDPNACANQRRRPETWNTALRSDRCDGIAVRYYTRTRIKGVMGYRLVWPADRSYDLSQTLPGGFRITIADNGDACRMQPEPTPELHMCKRATKKKQNFSRTKFRSPTALSVPIWNSVFAEQYQS